MPETKPDSALHPAVFWAQRRNVVYVNIALEDCKNPVVKLEKDKLYFRGAGGVDKQDHEANLEFFQEIKPEESKYVTRGRGTEFVLVKADEGPFWKRLLKEDKKFHWLKVDFNKWKDEDDSDDEAGGDGTDFEEMMRKMGGLKSGGADLGDLDNEADSDDEELPDLE